MKFLALILILVGVLLSFFLISWERWVYLKNNFEVGSVSSLYIDKSSQNIQHEIKNALRCSSYVLVPKDYLTDEQKQICQILSSHGKNVFLCSMGEIKSFFGDMLQRKG